MSDQLKWICYRPASRYTDTKWHLVPVAEFAGNEAKVMSSCRQPLAREQFDSDGAKRLCKQCAAFATRNGLRPPWHGGTPHRTTVGLDIDNHDGHEKQKEDDGNQAK